MNEMIFEQRPVVDKGRRHMDTWEKVLGRGYDSWKTPEVGAGLLHLKKSMEASVQVRREVLDAEVKEPAGGWCWNGLVCPG